MKFCILFLLSFDSLKLDHDFFIILLHTSIDIRKRTLESVQNLYVFGFILAQE